MYYSDFFMSSPPPPTPALSRLLQLGLKRKTKVAAPLTVLGDVTRDDSQRQFLAQHSVATVGTML